MSLTADALDHLTSRLQGLLRADQVLTSKADRYNRARTPAPFPVHRWSEHVPDVVVLPEKSSMRARIAPPPMSPNAARGSRKTIAWRPNATSGCEA